MRLRLALFLLALLSLPGMLVLWTMLFAVSPKYVDGSLAATCSGNTYSVANRTCTGSDGPGYKTVAEGIRALVVSDQLYVRAGDYTESGTYGNVATDTYGAGATSWATATKIGNYPGETVTITAGGFNMDHTISTGGIAYLIWQGDCRSRFIVQGAASGVGGGVGMRLVNGANHVRFQTMTVRNFGQDGIGGGSASCPSNKPDSIEIIDTEVSGNGDNANLEHGVYFSCSNNLLIDGSSALGNQGYGWHVYSATTNGHTNVTIRNTIVIGRKTGATGTAYGMVMATGSGNKAYNNIVVGQGSYPVKYTGCMQLYGPATAPLLYHNTCYDVTTGVEVGDSGVSAAEIINNIFATLTTPVSDFGTSTARSTNLCPSAATGCSVTGSPSFTDAAALNFSLQAGSTARDAGADLSATVATDYIGTARCQGSACDIGAYEYLVSSAGAFVRAQGINGMRYNGRKQGW